MNLFKKGWFTEYNDDWHGQSMSYEVDEVLFDQKSKFQVCHLRLKYFSKRFLRTFSSSKVNLMVK